MKMGAREKRKSIDTAGKEMMVETARFAQIVPRNERR